MLHRHWNSPRNNYTGHPNQINPPTPLKMLTWSQFQNKTKTLILRHVAAPLKQVTATSKVQVHHPAATHLYSNKCSMCIPGMCTVCCTCFYGMLDPRFYKRHGPGICPAMGGCLSVDPKLRSFLWLMNTFAYMCTNLNNIWYNHNEYTCISCKAHIMSRKWLPIATCRDWDKVWHWQPMHGCMWCKLEDAFSRAARPGRLFHCGVTSRQMLPLSKD